MIEHDRLREAVGPKYAECLGVIRGPGRALGTSDENNADRVLPGITVRRGISMKLLHQLNVQRCDRHPSRDLGHALYAGKRSPPSDDGLGLALNLDAVATLMKGNL